MVAMIDNQMMKCSVEVVEWASVNNIPDVLGALETNGFTTLESIAMLKEM